METQKAVKMKVAIVILNYNGKHYLEKFLGSVLLFSNLSDVEIIVADNASTDNSITFLKENYPTVRIIILSKNYGFAGGYNEALKDVNAEYYILLNSDVEVSENWIQPIISYMDTHPKVAACQPKILAFHDKTKFEHAGAAGGFIDYLGYPFCRGRIFNHTETDLGQYNNILEIFWASGACLFIRSKDFWDAKGFDSRFFAHMEEIDLCWRLNNRGRKLACIPQSVVYHVGGGTLSVENHRKTYLNFRNNLLMIYKNSTSKCIHGLIIYRMLLDGIAAIQFLVKGKTGNFKAIWDSHFDYRKMLPDFKQDRKENLKQTVILKTDHIYSKSIILQNYLLGNKFFSQLKWK